MPDWNSFKRIKDAFKHEIPDKGSRYEGSIEVLELNLNLRGEKE